MGETERQIRLIFQRAKEKSEEGVPVSELIARLFPAMLNGVLQEAAKPEEIVIALAGPAVNVVIAAVLIVIFGATIDPNAIAEIENKVPVRRNVQMVLFPTEENGRRGHVTLVTRWFDELRKVAPPSR